MASMPRIIGFYSYKGGVGRSLALAHCAVELARQGRKVLIIDLDLEAPGQHCTGLFHDQFVTGGAQAKGFLDFAHAYGQRMEHGLPDLRQFLALSSVNLNEAKQESAGEIYLLPAGNLLDADHYRESLGHFDWNTALSAGAGGFGLTRHLLAECERLGFDDVLVDSRTGDADPFYVVALELADILVMVSSYNRQNLLGTQAQWDLLGRYPEERRPKRIILVGSPKPSDIGEDFWSSRIRPLAPYLPDFEVELPYQQRLALSEDLLNLSPSASDEYTREIRGLVAAFNTAQDTNQEWLAAALVNPFSVIRADYASSKDLIRFFVDPGEAVTRALLDFMPVMVFGNRGTGKTMLAKHYSFETHADRLNHSPRADDLPQRIGLYLRFDIDLLNAFNTCDEALRPDFNLLFANFFDILVMRKALAALETFGGLEAWCDARQLFTVLLLEFDEESPPPEQLTYKGFNDYVDQHFFKIRRYLNNPGGRSCPVKLQGNILLKLLVEALLRDERRGFGERWFAVMVDEVEHFETYQQVVLNSRIKQIEHSDRVTYRYFLRHEGLRTRNTRAGEDQIIQESHDFRTIKLDEGIQGEHFERHLHDVASRQLELQPQLGQIRLGVAKRQIKGLFASLSPEEEARRVDKGRKEDELRVWLLKKHKNLCPRFLEWQDRELSVLRKVVGVILLNQGKPAEDIVRHFEAWDDRARDWYHNYHRAGLHWLCRLYRTNKIYAGLDQIMLLSGDNVRYFLEYCRAIVDEWIAAASTDAITPTLPISVEIQDRAIRARAQFYIDDLRGKPRWAGQMLILVKRLGNLFEAAHASPRQSQFEINHFSIADYDPARHPELEKWLRECRMENVLLRRPGSKQKSLANDRPDDWVLHPCFAPYFNISPRRKKKLDDLHSADLRVLFDGDEAQYKALQSRYEKKFSEIKPEDAEESSADMSLFDHDAD